MNQDIHTTFEGIIKKSKINAILPFLKDLSDAQRRELVKSVKKHNKHYSKFVQKGNTWTSVGSSEQNRIIGYAAFVCCSGQEYHRIGTSWFKEEEVEQIFEFYIPDWFNSYVHKNLKKDWAVPFYMDYDWMMKCYNRDILNPEPELIVKLLPSFLFDRIEASKGSYLRRNDNNLLKYPETLNEHIWLFFNLESDIHWVNTYSNVDKVSEELQSWMGAFKDLSDKRRIDRQRLLESCIHATAMNFNKLLTGWFMNLLTHLEPNEGEMISLQGQMNGVFSCQHSKAHNTILKYYKKLCTNKEFMVDDFIENAPILLSSEVKTTVNNTLMVLDKLAKKHTTKTDAISLTSAQALIHTDAAVQKRAAKIIDKYGSSNNEELVAEIANYQDILKTEPKALLAGFLKEEEEIIQDEILPDESFTNDEVIDLSNEIVVPHTIDDLIFFVSQAFDNNEAVHFDLLPAALLNLNNEITSSHAKGFQPALQRALKIVMWEWRSNNGFLDHLLATFFIEYIEILIQRFPEESSTLLKLLNKYRKEDEENCKAHSNYKRNIYPLKEWTKTHKSGVYKIFHQKLMDVIELLKEGSSLPLLSTPTHHPYWIDPVSLITKVIKWQKANKEIGNADFQLAISRTYLINADRLIERVKNETEGEIKQILCFLFDKNAKPEKPFTTIAHWWSASITKDPKSIYEEFENFVYSQEAREKHTGHYSWRVVSEMHESTRWDYEQRKNVKYSSEHKILKINTFPKENKPSVISKLLKRSIQPKAGQDILVYGDMEIKSKWYGSFENDARRFFSTVPNNPDKLLANVMNGSIRYSQFWEEESKRMFIRTLEEYVHHPLPYGPMGHLLTTGGMLCSDKTARSLAGEIWIQGSQKGLIDQKELGRCLGEHLKIEFAPLKRLTDLIEENLLRISQQHNKNLQLTIEQAFLCMDDNPIKGLKKLLEIYLELLTMNKCAYNPELSDKLSSWKSSKTIAKVIKMLPDNINTTN